MRMPAGSSWRLFTMTAVLLATPSSVNAARGPKAEKPPQRLRGEVVDVHDGDTISVLIDERRERVRLARIDAPELDQAFGDEARETLSNRVLGKQVTIEAHGRERYGRLLATVKLRGRSVNLRSVANGMAWHYRKYSSAAEYDEAERTAKRAKRGLWAQAEPVAPWEWRSVQKKK